MSTTDLKQEIIQAIDDAPDFVLSEILEYLKQIKVTPEKKIDLAKNLSRILKEDKELLHRLSL